MSASESRTVRAEPNVTPMIDVMLVLLIIFMVVTPVILHGTPVDPPTAANMRAHPEEPGQHTLTIDRNGRYYLDRALVPANELGVRLGAIYTGPVDRVLYIRADRDLDYAAVLDALDLARANGVKVAGMIGVPPR